MSRRRKSHHGIDISAAVLVFVGLAGAALAYRDRLIFAVGAGVVIGGLIGFLAGSRMSGKTYHYYAEAQPEPPRQQIRQQPRRELEQPRRKADSISGRMFTLSAQCMGRTDCLDCKDKRWCQCPCEHDPAKILAWNAARYDEEHEPEYDPADLLAENEDSEFPF